MSDTLIKVEHVAKKYCRTLKRSLWYGMQDLALEVVGRGQGNNGHLRRDEFWAVKDISFELKRGECLGLIGRNGAGKSTLLKMLNGIVKPDKGRIEMRGRIDALIQLGAGFNPILTGRENIYTKAAVLGFSQAETRRRFDAIVEFSELADALDTPVKYYSSGMKVRLGFAVASQMEPDILLVDEVLAVGDIGFVLKCFNHMDQLLSRSCIILVSHSIPQVARMSTNLIVMKDGEELYNSSDVPTGLSMYYSMFEQKTGQQFGSGKAILEEISLASGGRTSVPNQIFSVDYGEELRVRVRIRLHEKVHRPQIRLSFYDKEQRAFADAGNFQDCIRLDDAEGELSAEAIFPTVMMAQGLFSISVVLTEFAPEGRAVLFRVQSAIAFQVHSQRHGWAPIQFSPEWQLLSPDESPLEVSKPSC